MSSVEPALAEGICLMTVVDPAAARRPNVLMILTDQQQSQGRLPLRLAPN